MLDPISIISMTALIVAGISATNAFFDLIKTWRDRKKEQLKKRIEAAEHAFSTVPQVLKDNVASFKKLAGPKFDVAISIKAIMDSLKQFLRALDASFHLVQSGHSLGTDGLRRIVRNYEQDVVQALGSLSSRIPKQGDQPTTLNKAQAGLEDSSDFIGRYPLSPLPSTPTRSLQSWNLLQEFMADAGL